MTLRHDFARARLRDGLRPDLVVLSPGPGRPDDFAMRETLDLLLQRSIPIFGVCLGLQGIVEYFGGSLGVLGVPMHGKPSPVRAPAEPAAAAACRSGSRSAAIIRSTPSATGCRRCWRSRRRPRRTASSWRSSTGRLPIAAVQFHPESVLTSPGEIGMPILEAALSLLCEPAAAAE